MSDSIDQLAGSLTGSKATPGGTNRPAKKPAKKPASAPSGHPTNANPLATMTGAVAGTHVPLTNGRTAAPQAPPPVTTTAQKGSGPVYDAIARAATENGVPLALALAIAQHESGFDAGNKTGDHGTSFGLYQLHQGGELGSMTPQQAMDPYTNASVALRVVGEVLRQHPDYSWGQVAAAAQRPADPIGYARTIDGVVNQAKSNPNYFSTALQAHGGGGTNVTVTGAPLPVAAGDAAGVPGSQSNAPSFDPKAFAAALAAAGFSAHLINSDLGLKSAFQHAVATQQSVQDFQNAIVNTHWFQARTASQRQYDLQNQSDHTNLSRQVQAETASIQAQAVRSGVTVSPLRAHDLAVTAIRNGLTPEELQKSIAAEAHYNPQASYGGTYGDAINKIKASMANYHVTLDDKTLGQFAQQIAAGTMDQTKVDQFLQQQAASKYPWMKPQLDQGFTVDQLASPYKNTIAQDLGVGLDTISASDPLLQRGLQMPDGKGGYTTMPLWQFDQTVKNDPRWLNTPGARDSVLTSAHRVLSDFGLVS